MRLPIGFRTDVPKALFCNSRQCQGPHFKNPVVLPAVPDNKAFDNHRNPTSRVVPVSRYATVVEPPSAPYSELTVGIPRETFANERRVAITPQNVALLKKKGFKQVLVEQGAGALADFPDNAYAEAGATIVEAGGVWAAADIVLKVRGPNLAEIDHLHAAACSE
jgi:H+-translocating NAD(P) transhydrogenase